MKRIASLLLAACLLLSGCSSLFDGSYVNITPYEEHEDQPDSPAVSAADYDQLYSALQAMTQSGTQSGLIIVAEYDQSAIDQDIHSAVQKLMTGDPITAYAVEDIQFELGTSSGQSAIALTVRYVHDRSEIRKINRVDAMENARQIVTAELQKCSAGVVLYVENYEPADIQQWVEDHAAAYPELVMESPEVTVNLYPEEGTQRVVELKFSYRTSRDALRKMQTQVSPIITSAQLYVSGEGQTREKYAQLYSFLMERFESYTLETSITPAYSLLIHGVGDAKAFATVYAAICRQAGLDATVVSGTRQGTAWYWNIVGIDGAYYHVDLLRCRENGAFRMRTDEEMTGYVWDYSALPAAEG